MGPSSICIESVAKLKADQNNFGASTMTENQFLGLIERSSQQSTACEAQSHTLKQLLSQLPIHKIRVFLSSAL